MNAVNIIGRITKDPELRTSSGGKGYTFFTVAVNEFSGGQQYTQFVPCVAWEKTAENICKYVKKGAQIAVEGSLNVRQDNNNGTYNTQITVRANRVEFLGTSNNNTNTSSSNGSSNTGSYDFGMIEEPQAPQANPNDAILWDD